MSGNSDIVNDSAHCRACGGQVDFVFNETVLGRHRVQYFKCEKCGSLQSELPYWLAEAYSSSIAAVDTGVMIRNLVTEAAVCLVLKVCGIKGEVLDWGGGVGVLSRMLRDRGVNAYVFDRYAEPVLNRAFSCGPDDCQPDRFECVSLVEVLEHMERPAAELRTVFELRPSVLFARTVLYKGQGPGWWYLTPQTGQHIFFYSRQCLDLMARRSKYQYFGVGSWHVFTRARLSSWRKMILLLLLNNAGLGFVRVCLALTLRGRYAQHDFDVVNARGPFRDG